MNDMRVGVVVPVGSGRQANVTRAIECLEAQEVAPEVVVLVHDGPEAWFGELQGGNLVRAQVQLPVKHSPGMESPRNVGVRTLRQEFPELTHCWFLDSDIIVESDCLAQYVQAHSRATEQRVLIGPYEWMSPGQTEAILEMQNDPRWPSFRQHGPETVLREDLSAGLACFSGNIVWPIEEFVRIGGFWNELHHGRCEDGEIGLRAVAMGVPISFVPLARGWHIWHERNVEWIQQANARDVPMLNDRHPWVQGRGVFVVEEDGRRFNVRCPVCSAEMNTAEWWGHTETCQAEGL